MKETVGIDLADLVKADSYDAKVNRHVSIDMDHASESAGNKKIGSNFGSAEMEGEDEK